MKASRVLVLSVLSLLIGVSGAAHAQQDIPSSQPETAIAPPPGNEAVPLVTKESPQDLNEEATHQFDAAQYNSILFTYWEHVAIQDARKYIGRTRGVTEDELAKDLKKREDLNEKVKPPPEEREIRLAGIVYRSKADWTIWLNEERVTPDAIPEEVMDLRVYKNYIEFKWFDEYTNKIFPIRLRPHQRFNIDTLIFLPG